MEDQTFTIDPASFGQQPEEQNFTIDPASLGQVDATTPPSANPNQLQPPGADNINFNGTGHTPSPTSVGGKAKEKVKDAAKNMWGFGKALGATFG